ncbi:MAG: 3-phosphoserine/phosphohydroxythreonine transaminase [Planctomycetota bacterium]
MARLYNFSAGPCTLPVPVLEQVAAELLDYRGPTGQSHGMSIIEMSHRTPPVEQARDRAAERLRRLLGLGDDWHVLFLAGGATFQFGMLAMNLLTPGANGQARKASYTHSGAWAKKAIADAKLIGDVDVVFNGEPEKFMTLPDPASAEAAATDGSTYLHLTSNETIGGVQWKAFPTKAHANAPIVADMSSDFLSRPIDLDPFGLIYAGAQKNIGPAGVTVVLIRDELLNQCDGKLINYLNYAGHAKGHSMLNTPPVFQIYMVELVLEWLENQGGLVWAQEMATKRSTLLYQAIAKHGAFYRCPVDPAYRSTMNVVFRLPSEDLEKQFIAQADAKGLSGLKGHRSVGGCRASIYNAMTLDGVETLAAFMDDFAAKHG